MGRPWLSILGVIVIVMASLAMSLAPASAAKPVAFNAGGYITSISDGTVKPAGDSGRFVVVEREIGGVFLAGGDVSGPFTMYYKANVELASQAGNLHGTLAVGEQTLNLNGTIQPLDLVLDPLPGSGIPALPKLSISGNWNFTKGGQGQGTFTAWAIFIPTPDGQHIWMIPLSAFSLTGQWQP